LWPICRSSVTSTWRKHQVSLPTRTHTESSQTTATLIRLTLCSNTFQLSHAPNLHHSTYIFMLKRNLRATCVKCPRGHLTIRSLKCHKWKIMIPIYALLHKAGKWILTELLNTNTFTKKIFSEILSISLWQLLLYFLWSSSHHVGHPFLCALSPPQKAVLVAVTTKITISWDMTPYSLAEVYQHFRGMHGLDLQRHTISQASRVNISKLLPYHTMSHPRSWYSWTVWL
jgi:hypothetical protein